MPCYDGRVDESNNIAMRLACEYCYELEERGYPIPSWAREWWKDHVEWDRKHGRMHPEVHNKGSK